MTNKYCKTYLILLYLYMIINFNVMGCNCGKKSIATKKNTVVKTPRKASSQMPKRIIRRTSK